MAQRSELRPLQLSSRMKLVTWLVLEHMERKRDGFERKLEGKISRFGDGLDGGMREKMESKSYHGFSG